MALSTNEIVALGVFVLTYALIMSERVHRMVSSLLGASVILVLKVLPWERLPHYLDLNTIFLLMGMMVIVNTARESGLFEYVAIKTAKLSKGNPFGILFLSSIAVAAISSVLDNVTTVLLFTPMLIKISKLVGLSPLPFLLAEIFASNIGGTATLIGDPPNIIIGSAAHLSFNEFLVNMGPIALVDLLVATSIVCLIYRRELSSSSTEEAARKLEGVHEASAIKDPQLFAKSVVVIFLVVVMFLLHDLMGVEPAVIALLGASLLLLWSGESPREVLEKVEWTTLLFFGGLFIVVGGLEETGIIAALARWLAGHVKTTGSALLSISWFSAISSAIVDNIPLTMALVPLIENLKTVVNIYPLWWALSLGACLGGNGTAIGASANIIVIGIAEMEGIKITFRDFLKIGMLIMLVTVALGVWILWLRYVG